jgi:hypothetical protein
VFFFGFGLRDDRQEPKHCHKGLEGKRVKTTETKYIGWTERGTCMVEGPRPFYTSWSFTLLFNAVNEFKSFKV